MVQFQFYNRSRTFIRHCGFIAGLSFTISTAYLIISYLYVIILDKIYQSHTTPGGTYGLSDYISETLFFRYRYINTDWWVYPIELDPAVLFLTVTTAALLGLIAGRVSPAFFGFVFAGKSGSRRKFERGLWLHAKRQRRRFSWKTVLLTGVLIGSIGAGIGVLIDWQIYSARTTHYYNLPFSKVYKIVPQGNGLKNKLQFLVPIPGMPSPIGRGWFTLADGIPILSAVFIAGFCSVVIPARRAMRAGGYSTDPRCACCGYPIPPPSARAASICPECGYPNPSLLPEPEQEPKQEPPGIEN